MSLGDVYLQQISDCLYINTHNGLNFQVILMLILFFQMNWLIYWRTVHITSHDLWGRIIFREYEDSSHIRSYIIFVNIYSCLATTYNSLLLIRSHSLILEFVKYWTVILKWWGQRSYIPYCCGVKEKSTLAGTYREGHRSSKGMDHLTLHHTNQICKILHSSIPGDDFTK